ncbi:citrate lyase acyl carrier protein [Alkaliphilus crotonatoxidans]
MDIKTAAMAGTLESSDISIVIEPAQGTGITIELKSQVEKQYGEQIKRVVMETLEELKVTSALVKLNDKGALDCVIKARLQTAVLRAAGLETFQWGESKSCTN